MARFDGMVQGVVVQMRTDADRAARSGASARHASALSAPSGNSTKMDGDRCGSYSTSASASAVRHLMHQCTGFLPR